MNAPADAFIRDARDYIQSKAPDLMFEFDVYANEARFGRRWLEEELVQLKGGEKILEVGAGMFLLACQLKQEGFAITALEPLGVGFVHFSMLQKLVLEFAESRGIKLPVIHCGAEELQVRGHFDFAYSINVMEHVADVRKSLENVHTALAPRGRYRFVCPNYDFPYEPHFNILTLFSKELTAKHLKRYIKPSRIIPDAQGMWDSLNWISVTQVRRIAMERLSQVPVFNKAILDIYLDRAMHDPLFQDRHRGILSVILKIMHKTGIFSLTRYIPPQMLPVMDCTLRKTI